MKGSFLDSQLVELWEFKGNLEKRFFGSGALSGLLMDLGLLKINFGVFFLFLATAWIINILGHILTLILALRDKAKLYLT